MDNILNVAGVTTILVFILTLLFQYFPGLRTWWGGIKSEIKSLAVLLMYILVGAFVAFGGCAEILVRVIPQLLCTDVPTFLQYVFAVMIAVGSGQGIFELLPQMKDVQAARSERQY